MKKYFYILKMEIMSNFQYIFNLCFKFIGYAIIMFIYFNLWSYLYSNPNELINGYSKVQMIWYVSITEILWMSLSGRKLCSTIVEDVQSGNIAYKMNKPYSYIGYIVFNHLGELLIRFIVYVVLGFLLGFILIGTFPNISAISLILTLISSFLALIISILLITSIGLFAFFIEDSNPLYWVYSKLILVIGTLFPIEFYPGFLQNIIKYSPIYVVSYAPAKLFVDFKFDSILEILLSQGIYLVVSYLICLFIYKRGVKKINVNGG